MLSITFHSGNYPLCVQLHTKKIRGAVAMQRLAYIEEPVPRLVY